MPEPGGEFDAVLMIAFGGPGNREEILPYLRRIAGTRPVPRERLEEAARRYERIGGRSPLREHTTRQAESLEEKLKERGFPLPVYVGMRHWRPFLADAVREMERRGARRAVGLIMAPQQSDSGWEEYQRDATRAIRDEGIALEVSYTQPIFDHPGFIEAEAQQVRDCLLRIPGELREEAVLLFSAHSIPMRDPFASRYVEQLARSAGLVAEQLPHSNWELVYQSRSGGPEDPWLEPDINDAIRDLAARKVKQVIVVPIGFLCDHLEVLYDLDIEAANSAKEAGVTLLRAKTVHDEPLFIDALADTVIQRAAAG